MTGRLLFVVLVGCGGSGPGPVAPGDASTDGATEDAAPPEDAARPAELPTVTLTAGMLVMGSPATEAGRDGDEGPQQTLAMPAFEIDAGPVTAAAFEARLDEVRAAAPGARILSDAQTPAGWPGRCNIGSERGDHPANCVDWAAARAFCRLRGMDLPTEAEREQAARGGTSTPYFWGEAFSAEHAVSSVDCGTRGCAGGTAPVARTGPRCNAFGVCDVSGNVWEWTLTGYQPELGPYVLEVPDGEPSDPVIRGAAWLNERSSLFRHAHRGLARFADGLTEIGFRCVRR
jgi:formylglycine-generating enzyme required for sulfatase activity